MSEHEVAIPDEAVEAAAEALWHPNEHDDEWATEFQTYKDYLRAEATKALEAAAPYLLTRLTNAVINRTYEDAKAAALVEVRQRMADAYDEGLEAGDGIRPRGNPDI